MCVYVCMCMCVYVCVCMYVYVCFYVFSFNTKDNEVNDEV